MLAASSTIISKVTLCEGSAFEQEVHADVIDAFTDGIIGNVFDAGMKCDWRFALGFAAAIDGLASGTIDFHDPVGTVSKAYRDVNDVTGKPAAVTNVMNKYCFGHSGGAL